MFNKADLLAPFARKLLNKKYPDAIVLAATERETTRPLLTCIARQLKERWDDSAKVPEPLPTEPLLLDEDDDRVEGSADEGATLDDLLRLSGRRIKRAPPSVPPEPPRTDKVH